MSADLKIYNPSTLGPAIAPYSQAVVANGFAYLAGQVGLDEENNVVAPGDMREQTRVTIERIKTILAEFDAELTDVVSATVFITSLDDFGAFNEAWAEAFGDHRPARATVVAGLLLPGLVVEIQAVAAL
ncbi:RidA family protein [Blastococcus sp. SYSU DS0533]